MKKILVIALTVFGVSSAFAQFNQGRILAGGSVGLSTHTYKTKTGSTTTTTGKSTEFDFNPKAGYFLIDKLAVGAGIELIASVTKPESSSKTNSYSTLSLTPFVRYYLDPGIFFQGQVGLGSERYKYWIGSTKTTDKASLLSWSLGAGYAYFLNDNVAIEPFLGYQLNRSKEKSPESKSIDAGLFVNVGFQIYLGKK